MPTYPCDTRSSTARRSEFDNSANGLPESCMAIRFRASTARETCSGTPCSGGRAVARRAAWFMGGGGASGGRASCADGAASSIGRKGGGELRRASIRAGIANAAGRAFTAVVTTALATFCCVGSAAACLICCSVPGSMLAANPAPTAAFPPGGRTRFASGSAIPSGLRPKSRMLMPARPASFARCPTNSIQGKSWGKRSTVPCPNTVSIALLAWLTSAGIDWL